MKSRLDENRAFDDGRLRAVKAGKRRVRFLVHAFHPQHGRARCRRAARASSQFRMRERLGRVSRSRRGLPRASASRAARCVTQPAKTRTSVVKLRTAARVATMLSSVTDGRKGGRIARPPSKRTPIGAMWGRPSRAAVVTIVSKNHVDGNAWSWQRLRAARMVARPDNRCRTGAALSRLMRA